MFSILCVEVPLGLHLGHAGPGVAEEHLCGLQPEHLPHLRPL
ncbi:hypothetical protein [Limnoglobus roseus]|nr:hypothetical protein [Limnoglobus roseus]